MEDGMDRVSKEDILVSIMRWVYCPPYFQLLDQTSVAVFVMMMMMPKVGTARLLDLTCSVLFVLWFLYPRFIQCTLKLVPCRFMRLGFSIMSFLTGVSS